MEDCSEISWDTVTKLFSEGLGSNRVYLTRIGLHLHFDLADETQNWQFNRFAELVNNQRKKYSDFFAEGHEDKLTYFTRLSNQSNEPTSKGGIIQTPNQTAKVTIPLGSDKMLLAEVAHLMRIRQEKKTDGEIHTPVVQGDAEYPLTVLTGTPWYRVDKSHYGVNGFETVAPGDADIRRKQEFGLGMVLLPDRRALPETRDWLRHQAQTEEKKGIKPRAFIPDDWVSREGISRAQDGNRSLHSNVRKTFQRTK